MVYASVCTNRGKYFRVDEMGNHLEPPVILLMLAIAFFSVAVKLLILGGLLECHDQRTGKPLSRQL